MLVWKASSKVDIVNGYKLTRSDPLIRRVIGSLYNWLLHRFYPLPISDVDCDFRLIRKSLLNKITLSSTSGIICLELIVKLKKQGARFTEVGVHHYRRLFGKSQFFTLGNVWKTLHEHVLFLVRGVV